MPDHVESSQEDTSSLVSPNARSGSIVHARPLHGLTDKDEFLKAVGRLGASDLLLKTGMRPRVRVKGRLREVDTEVLPDAEFEEKVFKILSPAQQQRLLEDGSVDFTYDVAGSDRFRINVFRQESGLSVPHLCRCQHGIGAVAIAKSQEDTTMPTNVRVIHANDFIRATARGVLDLEESKKMLIAVASAAGPMTTFEILLDVRKAQVSLSTTDLWYLAAEFVELGKTFRHKTAVLCPSDGFNKAGFFETCAQNRGLNVRGFVSFEEAIMWLTGISNPDDPTSQAPRVRHSEPSSDPLDR